MDRIWILVEWVDEINVFPSYEVVNIDKYAYQDNDLLPGKQIFISLKNSDPRRAKVIRLSDIKRQVKEHKDFLERQDQQVKNVLQLCMRTIKEMKSDQYANSIENGHQIMNNGQHGVIPHVIMANNENSDNDSDTDIPQRITHNNKTTKFINQTHQNVRYDAINSRKGTLVTAMNQRRHSVMNSTPLPERCSHENIKLCFDQGTQTSGDWMQPPISKIEEIELVLKHLYGRFQSLVMRVNSVTVTNETIGISESEHNGDISYAEPNESWATHNNVAENAATGCIVEENNATVNEIGAEQEVETENQNLLVLPNSVKTETVNKNSNESMRVRRMSAQTTYSNEMIPIGNGRAMVPARLLNDIDWTSYTTATRQLLQAIFPRKVLATHSLTGKQSPAHLNKPPKKLLDPNLVEDIVIAVSSKSGVPKNLVRNSVTVKCADEAKLYRNRQRYQFSRQQKKQNVQNVASFGTHSSDDSLHYKE